MCHVFGEIRQRVSLLCPLEKKRQPDGLCSISTGEVRWWGGLCIVSIRIRQQDDLNIVSPEKYGSRMTWKSCPSEK